MAGDLPSPPGPAFGPGVSISNLPTDSRANTTIGVAAFCMSMGLIATALRLYTRIFIMRRIGVDDGFACLAVVFLVALAVAQVYNVRSGLGTHIYLLDLTTPASLVPFFKALFFTVVFYNIALLWIRMTLLFQYYRVVAQVQNLRWGYIVGIFIIASWQIAQIFLSIFSCTPVEKRWDSTIKGTCLFVNPDINAIGNIVSDFIVLILPLPVLFKLRLPRRQKLALGGIFCLGFFTCIISIARRVSINFTRDITYSSAPVSSFSIAEVASGIVCAALATLRPLLGRFFPSLTGTLCKLSGKADNNSDASEKGFIPDYKKSTGTDSSVYPSRPPTAATAHSARANHWASLFSPLKSIGLRSARKEVEKDGGPLSPEAGGYVSHRAVVRHDEQTPRKPAPPSTQPFQQHVSRKASTGSRIPPGTSSGKSTSQLHKSLPPIPPPSPLPQPFRETAGSKVIGGKEMGNSWPGEGLVRNPPPTALAQPLRGRSDT